MNINLFEVILELEKVRRECFVMQNSDFLSYTKIL